MTRVLEQTFVMLNRHGSLYENTQEAANFRVSWELAIKAWSEAATEFHQQAKNHSEFMTLSQPAWDEFQGKLERLLNKYFPVEVALAKDISGEK